MPRLLALEHRRLTLAHHELRAAHAGGGVEWQHAALAEPVEPVTERGQVQLAARDTQARRFEVRKIPGDGGRRDPMKGQGRVAVLAPRGEALERTPVGVARMRVRNPRGEELERCFRRSLSGASD